MSHTIDLDALLEQRAEATGITEGYVGFKFAGKEFTFRDHLSLTDDEIDELSELESGVDICVFYMGEEQYEQFVSAGGSTNIWTLAFQEHQRRSTAVDAAGNPTRFNRSQRRAAARKR